MYIYHKQKNKTILKYIYAGMFVFLTFGTPSNAGLTSWIQGFGLMDNGCGVVDDDAFDQYACPKYEDKERTLTGIDFYKGTATCKSGSANGDVTTLPKVVTECKKIYQPNIDKYDFSQAKAFTGVNTSLSGALADFGKRVGKVGVKFDPVALKRYMDSGPKYYGSNGYFQKLKDKLKNIKANKSNDGKTQLEALMGGVKIDSHTNYKDTLAAAITATFTVDPDYFNKGFVNNLGEADYKRGELKTVDGKNLTLMDWLKSMWGEDIQTTTVSKATVMDFMDKGVLGFFINMVQTLREVYNEMIFLFFVIGGVYSFGFFAYKKSLEKYGKEPFNINKLSFLSSTAVAFLFFSAPVINDGKIDNPYNGEINPAKVEKKIDNWTSLAQETVRYVAQSSNYFANLSSDKLMSTYLTMVAKKSGFYEVTPLTLSNELEVFDGIEKDKKVLLASLNFYNNGCRKYFNLKDDQFFNSKESIANMSTQTVPDNGTLEDLVSSGNLADRLDYKLCSKLESDITPQAEKLFDAIRTQDQRIGFLLNFLNTNTESAKRFKNFIKLMAFGQNKYGWIFTASIPVSYFFFDNAGLLLYDQVKKAGDDEVFKGELYNFSDELKEDEDTTVGEKFGNSVEWVFIKLGTSSLVQNTMFFIIPGFDSLFDFVDKAFQSFYLGEIEKAPNSSDAKNASSKFTSLISGIAASIGSKLKTKGIKKVLSNNSTFSGKLGSYAFTILALFTSIIIFTYIISVVTVVIITALLVLKITLYYIELMLFFLSVQVMGLYYVLMGQGQNKDHLGHFSKSLAGLFITPILIVLITGAIIPAGKFFKSFFTSIMLMLQAVVDNGGDFLSGVRNHTNANYAEQTASYMSGVAGDLSISAHKVLLLTGMQGMTTIFSYFAIMLISIILILNYKSWFMKMVGMEGGIDTLKESGGELRQGAAGKALNPVG